MLPPRMNDSTSTVLEAKVGFTTTHWSTVLAAGNEESQRSTEALGKLCGMYWYPLYAWLRRRGHSAENAEDLTQSFFRSLLQRGSLRQVTREKGRFRSFLLAALQHFVSDEWDKERALKRGGGAVLQSLNISDAEGRYCLEPAAPASPDELYDRQWAFAILEAALKKLRERRAADPRRFDLLQPCLTQLGSDNWYLRVAEELQSTPGAIKAAAHRLRQDYRELVRQEIANTVASVSDVDAELQWLLRVMSC
jgi:DNA-directed RNA polymerase specialized sigma24 family protein